MDGLLEKFLSEEATPYVRKILSDAILARSAHESRRAFAFNCFEIVLDFDNGRVVVGDVLDVGPDSEVVVGMDEFVRSL